MATSITCPGCSTTLEIGAGWSGERIECPSCKSILLLKSSATPRPPSETILPPPQKFSAKALTDADRAEIDRQARRHLSGWLDVQPAEVDAALALLESKTAYDTWQIPKAGGAFRTISSPKPELKRIQRRVLDRILYRIPVSNASHGFVPGRSIVTGASVHLEDARELVNIDLKDAFPSVDSTRVRHLLARHVKMTLKHLGTYVEHEVVGRTVDLLTAITTHEGKLPQGGPTSGCLLNLACLKLDKYIYRLLGRYPGDLRYTRYADDMTISSRDKIPDDVRQELQKIVRRCGFQVNPQKIRYLSKDRNQVLEVTGLYLEKGKIRIPPATLDRYRATIHQAAIADALDDAKKLEVQSIVAFVKMVYPMLPAKIAGPYKKYFEKHMPKEVGPKRAFGLDFYRGASPG